MRTKLLLVALFVGMPALAMPGADAVPEGPLPKTAGTDNDPLLQIELAGPVKDAAKLLTTLNETSWTSRTAVRPEYPGTIARERWHPRASAIVALGERKFADVPDLLRRLKDAGFEPAAIHLTDFGSFRLRADFSSLAEDKAPKAKEKTLPEEVRGKIAGVLKSTTWLTEAVVPPSGYKPDYRFAKPEVKIAFPLAFGQTLDILPLARSLDEAGVTPSYFKVARMFAGIPFGFPLPGDIELLSEKGEKVRSAGLGRDGRPLVLVFFPLAVEYTENKEKKAYRATPEHFSRLKAVAEKYGKGVGFAAVSTRKADPFPEVAELWRQAAMPFALWRDREQQLGAALSVGTEEPPPHIYLFDGERKLRYAGEFADGWVEPGQMKRIYLEEALDRLLAGKILDNEAVFNASPPCACSHPECKCPRCGCGSPCRCGCPTGKGCGKGFN